MDKQWVFTVCKSTNLGVSHIKGLKVSVFNEVLPSIDKAHIIIVPDKRVKLLKKLELLLTTKFVSLAVGSCTLEGSIANSGSSEQIA